MTSPCNTCIKANPIPTCSDEWVIADVPNDYNGSPLFYVVTNVATGAIYTGDTELVTLGEATITLPEELSELMGHYYKLDLYEDDTLQTPITITIGTDTGCCIEFTTFDMTSDSVQFTNTTCTND
jgi:hypothetical protein